MSPDQQLVAEAVQATADALNVTTAEIFGETRPQNIAHARHIAMWLCRHHYKMTFTAIGQHIGNRDHGTALHACKKIDRFRTDKTFAQALDRLAQKLPPHPGCNPLADPTRR